ncbi:MULTISPECIES: DegT/DnrJ/EryC1/StrS family aminotransferase [unclassified Thioalkalivibrio]|uniref:DegT/DnrJ/EryC1/StrS aminotransferase family protein n=1 Tax=unclassified Thioalkalivibrio TaxID=2621013 RepID=UPI00035E0582|nr:MULTISPECIES: DegT/DnrJ/EryC1/StrS family aminotransferase [unclassified Thioalkalivibrio]
MADRHYILDVSAILDMWLDADVDNNPTARLLEDAKGAGAKLWVGASALNTLDFVAVRRLKDLGAEPETARATVQQLMRQLLEWVAVLSLPGHEQAALYAGARDFEDAQLAAGARSLRGGSVAIITLEHTFDTLGECEVMQPSEALARLQPATDVTDAAIPFIDLAAQQRRIRPEIERRIETVLRHGKYIMGPEVGELEERLAAYTGSKHCISVSSGTDSLLIAMMALGIGRGDEVITTPFTFIATGEMIALLGARPVFVDIDPATYNIDPEQIEAAITPKTRAIMPVSLYGQCAAFDAINAIAEKHGLPVIEDGAQSFGATYKGRKSCALSTIGSTSFFPSKPLGGYGDGGALFTDDDNLAKAMREIRVHGQDRRYHHPVIGVNGRMDTLQAAILLPKLEIFAEEVHLRQRVAEHYSDALQGKVTVPQIASDRTSVFAQYTVQTDQRAAVQSALNDIGIPTAVHYPVPLYRQPAFMDLEIKPDRFPNCEAASERVVSLPMHPYLQHSDISRVVEAIAGAVDTEELT